MHNIKKPLNIKVIIFPVILNSMSWNCFFEVSNKNFAIKKLKVNFF